VFQKSDYAARREFDNERRIEEYHARVQRAATMSASEGDKKLPKQEDASEKIDEQKPDFDRLAAQVANLSEQMSMMMKILAQQQPAQKGSCGASASSGSVPGATLRASYIRPGCLLGQSQGTAFEDAVTEWLNEQLLKKRDTAAQATDVIMAITSQPDWFQFVDSAAQAEHILHPLHEGKLRWSVTQWAQFIEDGQQGGYSLKSAEEITDFAKRIHTCIARNLETKHGKGAEAIKRVIRPLVGFADAQRWLEAQRLALAQANVDKSEFEDNLTFLAVLSTVNAPKTVSAQRLADVQKAETALTAGYTLVRTIEELAALAARYEAKVPGLVTLHALDKALECCPVSCEPGSALVIARYVQELDNRVYGEFKIRLERGSSVPIGPVKGKGPALDLLAARVLRKFHPQDQDRVLDKIPVGATCDFEALVGILEGMHSMQQTYPDPTLVDDIVRNLCNNQAIPPAPPTAPRPVLHTGGAGRTGGGTGRGAGTSGRGARGGGHGGVGQQEGRRNWPDWMTEDDQMYITWLNKVDRNACFKFSWSGRCAGQERGLCNRRHRHFADLQREAVFMNVDTPASITAYYNRRSAAFKKNSGVDEGQQASGAGQAAKGTILCISPCPSPVQLLQLSTQAKRLLAGRALSHRIVKRAVYDMSVETAIIDNACGSSTVTTGWLDAWGVRECKDCTVATIADRVPMQMETIDGLTAPVTETIRLKMRLPVHVVKDPAKYATAALTPAGYITIEHQFFLVDSPAQVPPLLGNDLLADAKLDSEWSWRTARLKIIADTQPLVVQFGYTPAGVFEVPINLVPKNGADSIMIASTGPSAAQHLPNTAIPTMNDGGLFCSRRRKALFVHGVIKPTAYPVTSPPGLVHPSEKRTKVQAEGAVNGLVQGVISVAGKGQTEASVIGAAGRTDGTDYEARLRRKAKRRRKRDGRRRRIVVLREEARAVEEAIATSQRAAQEAATKATEKASAKTQTDKDGRGPAQQKEHVRSERTCQAAWACFLHLAVAMSCYRVSVAKATREQRYTCAPDGTSQAVPRRPSDAHGTVRCSADASSQVDSNLPTVSEPLHHSHSANVCIDTSTDGCPNCTNACMCLTCDPFTEYGTHIGTEHDAFV
jgi:hypothetical protein